VTSTDSLPPVSTLPTGCGIDDVTVVLNEWPSLDMLCTSLNWCQFLLF